MKNVNSSQRFVAEMKARLRRFGRTARAFVGKLVRGGVTGTKRWWLWGVRAVLVVFAGWFIVSVWMGTALPRLADTVESDDDPAAVTEDDTSVPAPTDKPTVTVLPAVSADGTAVDAADVPAPPAPKAPTGPKPFPTDIVRPVSGSVALLPGWRRHPDYGHWYFEPAVELAVDDVTPVRAALPGIVARVDSTSPQGHVVELDHGDGLRTEYKYLARVHVMMGQHVSGQAPVGEVAARPRGASSFDIPVVAAAADASRGAASSTQSDAASLLFAVYRDDEVVDVTALFTGSTSP